MALSLDKLSGMTESIQGKLKEAGIGNAEDLLEAAASAAQRTALADKVGEAKRDLLELANRADLSRVKGVAGVYSDLLEKAGVDTVKELATRNADNLAAKIAEVNEQLNLTQRLPTADDVKGWVEQAKDLPKKLTY